MPRRRTPAAAGDASVPLPLRPAPVALPSTQPSPDAPPVLFTQLQERLRELRKECGPKALGACTVEQARA